MATSSAKDAHIIMTFLLMFVFGILAFIGEGFCEDVTAQSLTLNQNQNLSVVTPDNLSEPVISIKNTTKLFADRYARFLSISQNHFTPLKSVDDNEIDDKQDKDAEDPTVPLYGIYYDCLFRLSFQCVQRKLLVFLDRLSRLKSKCCLLYY